MSNRTVLPFDLDRIAVMSSEAPGVVQLDTPHALYHHPQSLFVANFIGTSSTHFDHVAGTENRKLRTTRGFVAPILSGSNPTSGMSAALAVRPEKIVIERNPGPLTDARNQVNGVIESVVFLRESTTYLVRAGNDLFRAKRFHETTDRVLAAGDHVTLSWPPEDTSAFIDGREHHRPGGRPED